MQAPIYQILKGAEERRDCLDSLGEEELGLMEKLNRCQRVHLKHREVLIGTISRYLPELAFSPLPFLYERAKGHQKFLVVHLASQVFGAYEQGVLIRWGPISSGRKEHPTPTGMFHLNWKDRSRYSTVDPEWLLQWYFNFHNKRGLSFHAYELPGIPASHACLRLLERDARWLFYWGEEWKLASQGRQLREKGTPVLILDPYDFSSAPPWISSEYLKEGVSLLGNSQVG